jgi:hypothetical protein
MPTPELEEDPDLAQSLETWIVAGQREQAACQRRLTILRAVNELLIHVRMAPNLEALWQSVVGTVQRTVDRLSELTPPMPAAKLAGTDPPPTEFYPPPARPSRAPELFIEV